MICLCHVAEDNARVSFWMAAESNRHYQDLHATAGNTVCVLSPPAPTGLTLVDHLRIVLPWVMEVDTYYIHLGTALAMAAA